MDYTEAAEAAMSNFFSNFANHPRVDAASLQHLTLTLQVSLFVSRSG